MAFSRAAGILLHPTSLPGPGGIGSTGSHARRFVDTLFASGIKLWQILPLGPTGYRDSPYAGLSAFAGNPLLLDLDPLVERGLLTVSDLAAIPFTRETSVDFAVVPPAKTEVLRRAFSRFSADHPFAAFCRENADWLEDFALFMALKNAHGGVAWWEWESALRGRQPDALAAARERLESDMAFQRWLQYEFFNQWTALKRYANDRGVQIVGDIPIFVARDSSDVWANQHLFQLDEQGTPVVVAGVPPDYFSATGQLWGNPHYRWDVMATNGFAWWIERFRVLLRQVDIVRLDHFRGFLAAWQVPFGDKTAERGEWVPGPGGTLFDAIRSALGEVPIIAENLGVITPDVEALRHRFGFPGMIILQFAFSTDASDASLPHNLDHNLVVYTGTHDNDTTVGWYTKITPEERRWARRYLDSEGLDISWDLLRAAFASVADLAIVPLQDVLRLGSNARMNYPGREAGNWGWRFSEGDVTEVHVDALRVLSETYGRSARSITSHESTGAAERVSLGLIRD